MPDEVIDSSISLQDNDVFGDRHEVAPDCPYVGLVPFSDADAPRFFGREQERKTIIDNLKASRLTLLYGPSGVGKSSVLRAGVVYHLRLQSRRNLAELGTPKFVVAYFNSWREGPLLALSTSVTEAVRPFLREQLKELVTPEDNLAHVLQVCSERANATLLVILDQFEEYFLYHPKDDGEGTFDVEFPRALNQPDLRANFLISMREDLLAQLDRLKGRIPNVLGNYLRIEHLDLKAARSAIEKPLEWYNTQSAEKERRFSIEPELVEELLRQVTAGQVILSDAGRGVCSRSDRSKAHVETPYLQLVMTRLWEEEQLANSTTLRLNTLRRLGDATEIINRHLDEAMHGLSAEEQKNAASIFHYLVTPSRLKIAQTLGDLATLAGVSEQQLAPLLDKLCLTRVLRSVESPPDRPEDPRYQVFHDVLAPAVLAWRAKYVKAQELQDAENRAEEEHRRAEKEAQTAKRLRWISISLILCFVLVAVAGVYAWHQRRKATEEAQFSLAQELSAAASGNLQRDPQLSLLLALQAVSQFKRLHKADALPAQFRDDLTEAVLGSREVRILQLENRHAKVLDASFSPDGTRLVTSAEDGTAEVWDVMSGRIVFSLQHEQGAVSGAMFSPGGRYIASYSLDGTTRLYSSSGATLDTVKDLPGVVPMHIAFTTNEQRLVIAKSDSTIDFWDISAGTFAHKHSVPIPKELVKQFVQLDCIAFSSLENRRIAMGFYSGDAIILDLTVDKAFMLRGHSGAIQSIAFSPDGSRVATGSMDGTAKIWDAHTGQLLTDLIGHTNTVFKVAFDPSNSSRVATASADGTSKIWDVVSGRLLVALLGHKNVVNGIAFKYDGSQVVTASWDGTAILWDTSSFHTGQVNSVAIRQSRLASASQDGTARLWDTTTLPFLKTLSIVNKKTEALLSVALSPNGEQLAAVGANGYATVWDLPSGKELRLRSLRFDVNGINFSPTGDRLVTAHTDGTARVWNSKSAEYLFSLEGHTEQVNSAIFNPKGEVLVTGSADKTVRFWDAATGKPLPGTKDLPDQVLGLAYSPDGSRLAASTLDGTVIVFDMIRGGDFKLTGHTMAVTSVAFDASGNRLATASWDRTARVWDLGSHRELFRFTHPSGGLESIVFSPDAKFLVTACDDGLVRLLPMDDDTLLRMARARVTRALTLEECGQYLHSNRCPTSP